jgi:hypothetical protein
MDGWKSGFKDYLQQSKIVYKMGKDKVLDEVGWLVGG